MKKAVIVIVAVLLLAGICWAQEHGAPKGQDVTITGLMTCTFCTLKSGLITTKESCVNCVKVGDPVLLTDAKGNRYTLLGGEQSQPLMTPDRMDLLDSKVTVTGILVKSGGIQVIYVKKMEKAF